MPFNRSSDAWNPILVFFEAGVSAEVVVASASAPAVGLAFLLPLPLDWDWDAVAVSPLDVLPPFLRGVRAGFGVPYTASLGVQPTNSTSSSLLLRLCLLRHTGRVHRIPILEIVKHSRPRNRVRALCPVSPVPALLRSHDSQLCQEVGNCPFAPHGFGRFAVLVYALPSVHDTVKKAWFLIAAWVQVMGEKAVSAVEGLERRWLPVKFHFSKCLEGLIPPDFEEVKQYMSSTTVTMPMISKRAKHLKTQRLWEQHMCHPENHLVDPNRKTLAEWARCEQCLLSKTHISFKVYNWKWSPQNYWPPWKYVVTAAIWSDPTYSALRDALKRPIVHPELNIVPDVNFLTVNIGFDSPQTGVADSEKLEGFMHVTGMALGTPLHSTVADMPYCLIIVEVPRGLMEGIHSVVSRNGLWNACSSGW